MSVAEKMFPKFHICPPLIASPPNVHFLDNISAADKISRYTSRQGGFIKLALVILENLVFIPSLEEKEVDFFLYMYNFWGEMQKCINSSKRRY